MEQVEQNSQIPSKIPSLISKIHASSASFVNNELRERGLPELVSSHGNILFQLTHHQKMTMSEITSAIHRDKSTTTVLIKKLEKEGYVQRTTCTDDSRVTWISLTQRGKEYTSATCEISRALSERCLNGFTDEEKQQAFDIISRIANNFQ